MTGSVTRSSGVFDMPKKARGSPFSRIVASVVTLSILLAAIGPAPVQAMGAAASAARVAAVPVGVPQVGALSMPVERGAPPGALPLPMSAGPTLALPASPVPRAQSSGTSAPSAPAPLASESRPAAPTRGPAAPTRGPAVPASDIAAARSPSANPDAGTAPEAAAARDLAAASARGAAAPAQGVVAGVEERVAADRPEGGLQKAIGDLPRTGPGNIWGFLGRLFDNSRRSSAGAAPVPAQASEPRTIAALSPAAPRGSEGAASQDKAGQEPAKPRSSMSRSIKVGITLAAIGLAVNVIVPMVAHAAGYQFHPNYRGPNAIPIKSLADIARMAVASTVMAPVTEEVAFRGVLMGSLAVGGAKLANWLGGRPALKEALGHWLPAIVSSVIFVALHETADMVAFGIRLATALLMSEAFHREGLFASISLHIANNLVPMVGMVGGMLLGPPGGALLSLLTLIAEWALANKFWGELKDESPERKAGLIVPKPLTPAWALGMAALSGLGVLLFAFSVKGAILWGSAGVVLALYAALYAYKRGPPFGYPSDDATGRKI